MKKLLLLFQDSDFKIVKRNREFLASVHLGLQLIGHLMGVF